MPSTNHRTHHADPAVALPWPAPDAQALVARLARALHAKRDAWAVYDKAEQETGFRGPRTNQALYDAYANARALAVEARGALEDHLLGAAL